MEKIGLRGTGFRPASAPGVSRTPDLQVRSLRAVRTQPISYRLSSVGTRKSLTKLPSAP